MTTTLHIEHAITDFPTWHAAFQRFENVRTRAGVIHQRILQPIDDPNYVVIELDFAGVEQATNLLAFLRSQVWPTPTNAPALVGAPTARILRPASP